MKPEYWQLQSIEPLFPNLIWSRPETKLGAGKLLIIGGQAQEFAEVAEAYAEAEKAGAGTIRVILPDSTERVTRILPNIEYAASNTSGSFARQALAELIDASQWADGVLLAGNLGKNSETTLMIDSLTEKYNNSLFISGNSFESITLDEKLLIKNSVSVFASLQDFQKLVTAVKYKHALTSGLGDVAIAKFLHNLTTDYPIKLALKTRSAIWVAYKGRVSSTSYTGSVSKMAAHCSVWSIQQPNKQYEALTSAVFEIQNN